jgi:cobalamin synthase
MRRELFFAMSGTAALAVALMLIGAEPVLAATSDVGKNLGNEVKTWATTLLLGVAALVAIPVIAKRDVNGGVVLALLVVLVGGFAFAPEQVKHVIDSVWQSVAG